jgi:hypothetical protein
MSEATSGPVSPNAPPVVPGVTPPPVHSPVLVGAPALAPPVAPIVKPVTTESRLDVLEKHAFGGPAPVPNHEIIVGDTVTIPIATWDAQDKVQPLLAGDTFTARSSNANMLEVGITAVSGGPALVVTGRRVAEGIVAIVEDAKGLRSASERFNVVEAPKPEPAKEAKDDPAPVALVLVMDKAVVTAGMAMVQKRLTDQGYTQVTVLPLGNDAVWRGQATKDGRTVNVAIDDRGIISET